MKNYCGILQILCHKYQNIFGNDWCNCRIANSAFTIPQLKSINFSFANNILSTSINYPSLIFFRLFFSSCFSSINIDFLFFLNHFHPLFCYLHISSSSFLPYLFLLSSSSYLFFLKILRLVDPPDYTGSRRDRISGMNSTIKAGSMLAAAYAISPAF